MLSRKRRNSIKKRRVIYRKNEEPENEDLSEPSTVKVEAFEILKKKLCAIQHLEKIGATMGRVSNFSIVGLKNKCSHKADPSPRDGVITSFKCSFLMRVRVRRYANRLFIH